MDIKKLKGKQTTAKVNTSLVRLNEKAYEKVKKLAAKHQCTMSDAITEHLFDNKG